MHEIGRSLTMPAHWTLAGIAPAAGKLIEAELPTAGE